VANYYYQDKLFQILINGRTGKVSGERPWSWMKIFRLIAIILLVIGLIVGAVALLSGGAPPARKAEAGGAAPWFAHVHSPNPAPDALARPAGCRLATASGRSRGRSRRMPRAARSRLVTRLQRRPTR
jgi:H+/Cl- antiporter ClcA